jgi:FkbM family methyltransferase
MMVTKYIYPLSLRERVSNWIDKFHYKGNFSGKNISLEFNRKVKLDLIGNDVGHRSIILNGFYELGLTQRITSLAKEGGLLVDVGANYGYFSCLWAAARGENSVIAFEANPANISPLMFNVKRNGLDSQVRINSTALGKEIGRMRFYTGAETNQTGWGGLMPNEDKNSIEVDVETLDNVAIQQNIDRIDVLKIDTEGADTWILQGATSLLRKKVIKHVFYESNLARMKNLNIGVEEASQLLIDCGYKVHRIDENEYYASCV